MHKNKGFTLIELIVVIVILAVITAIALGGYSKYIGMARKNTCKANRESICEALRVRSSADGGLSVSSIEDELDKMGYHIDHETGKGLAYGDICLANGNVSININKNIVTITCDIHNTEEDKVTFKDSLDIQEN